MSCGQESDQNKQRISHLNDYSVQLKNRRKPISLGVNLPAVVEERKDKQTFLYHSTVPEGHKNSSKRLSYLQGRDPSPEVFRTPRPRISKSLEIWDASRPVEMMDYAIPLMKPQKRSVSDCISSSPRKIKNFGHSKHNRLILKANRMILDRSRIKPRQFSSNNAKSNKKVLQ